MLRISVAWYRGIENVFYYTGCMWYYLVPRDKMWQNSVFITADNTQVIYHCMHKLAHTNHWNNPSLFSYIDVLV